MMRVGVIALLIAGLASSSMASHLTGRARSNGIQLQLPGSTVAGDDAATVPPTGNVVNATWTLRHDVRAPDGYMTRVVTVNDEFMPELRVKQGDLVMITVRNEMLNDAASIHWHGFEQLGSPWSDGAAYVSQCPINRQDFRYEFVAEASPGTYMWHGHFGAQRVHGLTGMLIVDPSDEPPVNGTPQFAEAATQSEYIELLNSVDGEIPLFINGWYHEDTDLQLARWQDVPFQLPVVQQSILVNGKGTFDCSLLDGARETSRCNESLALGPEVFDVAPGGTYLVRLINGDFDSIMFASVEGHTLTIIGADGRPVVPFETTMVFMQPGQRYDALLTADRDAALYNIYITHRPIFGGGVATLNTTAILAYEGAQGDVDQTFAAATDPDSFPNLPALDWDERNLNNVNELPEDMAGEDAADRTIELFTGLVAPVDEVQGGPNLLWYMGRSQNDTSAFNTGYERSDLGFPVQAAAFHDRMDIYGDSLLYEELGSGEVVDVILHNTGNVANLSFNHVFHLHGYHFFVIGIGPGEFDMETHREMLNFVNPPMRDSATLPGGNAGPQNLKGATTPSANGPFNPSSWLYLRFRTQNPGAWFFHCHLGYHRLDRQGMFFIVDPENIPPPPSHHPRCGEWFEWEVLDRLEEAGCLAA